ncbi:MAG: phosphoglycerate mutase family protein [Acidimicrobiales bacterium]
MTIYLVRHATAGTRQGFRGADLARPLDDFGKSQAAAISAALKDERIERVLSSRATRCIDTVAPLAHALGLEVEITDDLTEGAAIDAVTALLLQLGSTSAALCSHGDVIPATIRQLMLDGMRITGSRQCEKGAIWRLDLRGNDIVTGSYLGLPRSLTANS